MNKHEPKVQSGCKAKADLGTIPLLVKEMGIRMVFAYRLYMVYP